VLIKIETWDQKAAEEQVGRRFREAKQFHAKFHPQWRANELTLFAMNGASSSNHMTSFSLNSPVDAYAGDLDQGNSMISINHTFRYHRYLLGLMSANPPTVICGPVSSDPGDRAAASVADKLANWARRQYNMQEVSDQRNVLLLTHGTAWAHACHDPWRGDLLKVYKNGTALMSGDFRFRAKSVWEIMRDPVATVWDDVRYVFIMHVTSREEAMARFRKHRKKIETYRGSSNAPTSGSEGPQTGRSDDAARRDTLYLWQYVERGLPWNGMQGRQMWLLDDGTAISDIETNPNPEASLPVFPITDVDVPGQVEGKCFVDYMVRLQSILDRLDSTVLDNIQAHGTIRMVIFDGEPREDNQPTNGPWQLMSISTGGQTPQFINPPTLMPDIYKFRDALLTGLESLAGMNEAMTGQITREMSAVSQQTAISAGNMVRTRVFNKYKACTEWEFNQFFKLVNQHWSDKRKIMVTGKEGAMEVAYYSAADLRGGFDLHADYGVSFSLDPARRREEIMQLMPLLKEAGLSMRQILQMMRLNDTSGLFDMSEMAGRRQLEVFDEMISKFEESGTAIYIKPEELEAHDFMLQKAYEFRQSMAFKVLERPVKALIEQHIKDREQLAATPPSQAGGAPGAPGAPQAPGAPDAAAANPLAALAGAMGGAGAPPAG